MHAKKPKLGVTGTTKMQSQEVDATPILQFADIVIANTDKPRVLLETAREWCYATEAFLESVKVCARFENRKRALAHSKLLVLAVGQVAKRALAIANVSQVPASMQQGLKTLAEDAKTYARNIHAALYDPTRQSVYGAAPQNY